MSERECDRAAARIAPPANKRIPPRKRQARKTGRASPSPTKNVHRNTNEMRTSLAGATVLACLVVRNKSIHRTKSNRSICVGDGASTSRKQTHIIARSKSVPIFVGEGLAPPATTAHYCTNGKPENGTSKPVPYKRTPTAKYPPAVILSVLSEMREKNFVNQKTESPRRISRRSMFAQKLGLLVSLRSG